MITDQNIIIKIKKGDKSSFKAFFNDFYPVLCAFAERFLKNPDLSEDVAQEVLIKFWERREKFDDLNGAKSFLYVVVKNTCINMLKQTRANDDLSLLKELESESFLKQNIIDHETFLLVRSAVENLPTRMKEIIELSMQGMKNAEIAGQMGISPLTVHKAKKNAYRKLRELLKDNYYLIWLLYVPCFY
ncbi:MAG: RNA polymerase sigma-70 factor [Mangrovibacterium sp.]|jgi:RNA polymerase sigma-70 factor (ECF subfamily)